MALSGPRRVEDADLDAVVSEMFGPATDEMDLDLDPARIGPDEEFGRRGTGRGRRGGRGFRRPGRRWGRRRGHHRPWYHRGPWFYPYWWWGYPLYYYPPADVDPDELAEEVADSMFSERAVGGRR